MIVENVYNDRDNEINLLLTVDKVVQNLSAVTKAAIFGEDIDLNSDDNPELFDLSEMSSGKLTLKLGGAEITAGKYIIYVITYDANNANGIVWGRMIINVYDIS